MNATGFARAECANWMPDGSCLGMHPESLATKPDRGEGEPFRGWATTKTTPLDRCLLAAGKRCRYFELCVLPLADRVPRYEPARVEYLKKHRQDAKLEALESKRTCTDCGAAIAKGHRFCPLCGRKRRKETWRRSQNKVRGTCQQNSRADCQETGISSANFGGA